MIDYNDLTGTQLNRAVEKRSSLTRTEILFDYILIKMSFLKFDDSVKLD